MYQQIGKSGLHLSEKVLLKTDEFGRIQLSVITEELSRARGLYRYATQIPEEHGLNQRLKLGFIRYYSTEEEARQGHIEVVRKLRNAEFQFTPVVYKLEI